MGEPGAARRGRDDRGDALVAVDAGDLLDEVLGGGEVGAPGRRGHREQVPVAGDRAADRLQDRDDLALEVDDADDLRREVDVHRHRYRVGRGAHVGDVRVGDSPAVLDEQVDGELGRGGRERRVDAALEAARGLAGQLVPAGRARDGDRLEVRGLDEHVAGRRTDLGLGAAHDAGDRDGALAAVVGDEQVARVEGAVDVVEGRQPLAGARTAHDDRALEGGEVEGVQRLAEAEHHVVRDVDRQRDRAHARPR